ncbi:hypothetical protein N657DRAFT_636602 [Parathielavia appendiculata]|uniref:Uncharacterized protein n=1 Tax=Parathielavia appendiculata TaxID=2587402 RepID=A0AAN6TTD7_9PEZI|nr:hypothetical protein N657DRAFT_636602 [Parathielavia appendiculata]
MARKDLSAVTAPGSAASLLDKVHMMETIIQLLVFELFVGGASSAALQPHLTPALALFEKLISSRLSLRHIYSPNPWHPFCRGTTKKHHDYAPTTTASYQDRVGELNGPLGLSSVIGGRNCVLRAMRRIAALSELGEIANRAAEAEDDEAHRPLREFASSTFQSLLPTRIWTWATSIYLSGTVNGWSPGESGVCS